MSISSSALARGTSNFLKPSSAEFAERLNENQNYVVATLRWPYLDTLKNPGGSCHGVRRDRRTLETSMFRRSTDSSWGLGTARMLAIGVCKCWQPVARHVHDQGCIESQLQHAKAVSLEERDQLLAPCGAVAAPGRNRAPPPRCRQRRPACPGRSQSRAISHRRC